MKAKYRYNFKDATGTERRYNGGPSGKIIRDQYLALLDAIGTKPAADRLIKTMVIKPPNAPWPGEKNFMSWAHDWQTGEMEADPKLVRLMKQRLMAHEEWENRRVIKAMRDALVKTAEKSADGTLAPASQVQIKYLADGIGLNTQATAAAFGTPKPTQAQMNVGKLVINAGERPPPRILKPPKTPKVEEIIEAEVRELPVGNGD